MAGMSGDGRDADSAFGVAITRRGLMRCGAGAGAGLLIWRFRGGSAWARAPEAGVLDAGSIPKFVTPLVIPPAMPRTHKHQHRCAGSFDYYEIAVRQFRQQICPHRDTTCRLP
jgi:hypothetical protein